MKKRMKERCMLTSASAEDDYILFDPTIFSGGAKLAKAAKGERLRTALLR
jgi:hypothetical protein